MRTPQQKLRTDCHECLECSTVTGVDLCVHNDRDNVHTADFIQTCCAWKRRRQAKSRSEHGICDRWKLHRNLLMDCGRWWKLTYLENIDRNRCPISSGVLLFSLCFRCAYDFVSADCEFTRSNSDARNNKFHDLTNEARIKSRFHNLSACARSPLFICLPLSTGPKAF